MSSFEATLLLPSKWSTTRLVPGATSWILTCAQWFNTLEQPMMIVVWTKDWPDTAKFQCLFQILDRTFKDYIPKWQIFVEHSDDFQIMVLQWKPPSTVWARTSSSWLHGRNRLSRCPRQPSSRSWFSRYPSDVIIPSNSSQCQLREYHLRHGCKSSLRESEAQQRCSNCPMSHCCRQGVYRS